MTNDSLEQLLASADASARPPSGNSDLAVQVQRRLQRRRTGLRATAALIVVGIIAAIWLSHPSKRPVGQIVVHDIGLEQQRIDHLRGEVMELASDAAVHERVANALLLIRQKSVRLRERDEALTASDPLEDVNRQRDRAAEILVRAAQRAETRPDDPARATEIYREVARIFPDTNAGKEAARRLALRGV